ncbi:MAG: MFS transporter [Acidobacteria bacterium]|nr:MFS transporter [Acidobacteriota bacterium]
MLKRTFKAFESREFRTMWIGACMSSIGTWMQMVAQSWLVYEISGSSRLLGLDAFLGQIPIMLLSLVGGVVADRVERRYILIASQLVQMSCAFTLTALVALGLVEVWHILTLSFVVGLAQAFGGPAYQALIPTLVKTEDLPNAIALNSIQFNLARVIGPVLGGLALAKLGAAWCFGLNGISFIAVIITLLIVRSPYKPQVVKETMIESMKQGLRFIRRQESMVALIGLAFLLTALGVPTMTFLPVFVKSVFAKGPETYTLLLSVSGAGSVLGALLVATFGHSRHKGLILLVNICLLGIFGALFSQSTTVWVSCVFLFLGSMALISAFALISSLVQLIATDQMRGRVMSVYNVAFRGGMPIGNYGSGEMIERITAPPVIAANGVLLVLTACYFYLVHKKVAKL